MHKGRCVLYAFGEMGPEETARFQAHLGFCPGLTEAVLSRTGGGWDFNLLGPTAWGAANRLSE